MARTPSNRTPATDVAGDQAMSLLANWKLVHNIFGGRAGTWEVSESGIVAHDFTMGNEYTDSETLLADISHQNKRPSIFPSYFYLQGGEPEAYSGENAARDISTDLVQAFKGAVSENSSQAPVYARSAAAAYKAANSLGGKRGRPATPKINLNDIDSLEVDALAGVSPDELDKLIAIVSQARANQASATVVEAAS